MIQPAASSQYAIAPRHPGAFIRYLYVRVAASVALQIQVVAVGWQMYALTGSPFRLGLIGLVQFIPAICLFPFTGHVADRFDRRWVTFIAEVAEAARGRGAGDCELHRPADAATFCSPWPLWSASAAPSNSRACRRCCPMSYRRACCRNAVAGLDLRRRRPPSSPGRRSAAFWLRSARRSSSLGLRRDLRVTRAASP